MFFTIMAVVVSSGLFSSSLESPAVSVGRNSESTNYVEVCSGIAVSPRHAVTLYAFTRGSDVFLVKGGCRIYPDSLINFRDMGLSMMLFEDSVFQTYEQPRNTIPPNGSALIILANHPTGFSAVRTFPLMELDDGALLLAAAPSSELMGAPVFDSYNSLAGIVAGSFDPGDGRGELMALVPCSLWYFWVETMLSDAGLNRPVFGLTAMPATTGLSPVQGILILDVAANSIAEQAGLREGDIITTINGDRAYHPEALKVVFQNTSDEISLSVRRDSVLTEIIVPSR